MVFTKLDSYFISLSSSTKDCNYFFFMPLLFQICVIMSYEYFVWLIYFYFFLVTLPIGF